VDAHTTHKSASRFIAPLVTAMHGYNNARIQQCTDTAMHGFNNARIQQCTDTAMHGYNMLLVARTRV